LQLDYFTHLLTKKENLDSVISYVNEFGIKVGSTEYCPFVVYLSSMTTPDRKLAFSHMLRQGRKLAIVLIVVNDLGCESEDELREKLGDRIFAYIKGNTIQVP